MNIKIIQANYTNTKHANDIIKLLNAYALDKTGGGHALLPETQKNLVNELAKLSYAFSILAYDDNEAIGLVNCFELFSTFACKPLINIHDLTVIDTHRKKGISQKMLKEVESIAKQRGCCKLTLEVLSGNDIAKYSYEKFGFKWFELDSSFGKALFWEKVF